MVPIESACGEIEGDHLECCEIFLLFKMFHVETKFNWDLRFHVLLFEK